MKEQPQLKRTLGLPLLTLYGLGTILGAGIYVLIGEVAAAAGMYAPISFLMAGLVAGFSAFTFAELSARYPQSAGEAVFVKAAFSLRSLSAVVGWLVITTGLVSAATILVGFTGYFLVFVEAPSWIVVLVALFTLTALAVWGIAESVTVAAIITCIEIAGLMMVLVFAAEQFAELPNRLDELVPPFDNTDAWLGITLGAFLAFYAFIGFEDMVNVVEEVKNPTRNMPIAIIAALLIASILYVAVALIAVLSLPIDQLRGAQAPMTLILSAYSDSAGKLIAVISMIAVINGALIQMIMGARVLYGMAREQMAPVLFARVSATTNTPVAATLLIALAVACMALSFPLLVLAKLTSFIVLSIFVLVNAALATLKWRRIPHHGMTVPFIVPVFGGVLSLAFLAMSLLQI